MEKSQTFAFVRVHASTGYNRVEGNRRASRNGRSERSPPRNPHTSRFALAPRCIQVASVAFANWRAALRAAEATVRKAEASRASQWGRCARECLAQWAWSVLVPKPSWDRAAVLGRRCLVRRKTQALGRWAAAVGCRRRKEQALKVGRRWWRSRRVTAGMHGWRLRTLYMRELRYKATLVRCTPLHLKEPIETPTEAARRG
jgi:hypothetical protein